MDLSPRSISDFRFNNTAYSTGNRSIIVYYSKDKLRYFTVENVINQFYSKDKLQYFTVENVKKKLKKK